MWRVWRRASYPQPEVTEDSQLQSIDLDNSSGVDGMFETLVDEDVDICFLIWGWIFVPQQ